MQSTHYFLTFGVNEGFSVNNTEANKLEVGETIKNFIQQIEEETGVYVSGVLIKNQALYKDEWKCPYGGEVTFTYMGDRNNNFCHDDEKYRKCVIKLAQMIKEEYKQEEIIVSFTNSNLVYID
ncbi:MAG: hypothetical protein MJ245_06010 [Clostridia bacterium]|nr:hypothetical protein [Clostridia bacterium]